jgi:hypothetical protein
MNYDVFICHVSEDKERFVTPLAESLKAKGARVWFDKFTMEAGDSLRESIDLGLASCTYGAVILSPAFIEKQKWAKRELNGLFAREMAEERRIIVPVYYGINEKDLAQFSPLLADVLGIRYEGSITSVANEILEKIRVDAPYVLLAGKQLVRILDSSASVAKIEIHRKVRVGKLPLSEMKIRISTTGNTPPETAAPGTIKGVRHENGVSMLSLTYDPPIPAETIFDQMIVFDAPGVFNDPENRANVVPTLPYEYFELGVSVPKPAYITGVSAVKAIGTKEIPFGQLRRNSDGTGYTARFAWPEVGYRHSLIWKWKQ